MPNTDGKINISKIYSSMDKFITSLLLANYFFIVMDLFIKQLM